MLADIGITMELFKFVDLCTKIFCYHIIKKTLNIKENSGKEN